MRPPLRISLSNRLVTPDPQVRQVQLDGHKDVDLTMGRLHNNSGAVNANNPATSGMPLRAAGRPSLSIKATSSLLCNPTGSRCLSLWHRGAILTDLNHSDVEVADRTPHWTY